MADQHIKALRRLGHTVVEKDLFFDHEVLPALTPLHGSTAIIHPLFYYTNWHGVNFSQIVETLARNHAKVYGIEVADTDSISGRFVRWANHAAIDGIMLPSRFSVVSYRNSGVTNLLGLVPHGVEAVEPDETFGLLKLDGKPKILFFTSDLRHRKGLDLLIKTAACFRDCVLVVKGARKRDQLQLKFRHRNVVFVDEWLSPSALASLYTSCDVLLALHRGGAFELHCLEALSYGLPVLAPCYGAVLDYLNPGNATLISGQPGSPLHTRGNDHSGRAFECNLVDIVHQTRSVLADLAGFKMRAKDESDRIRKLATWERAAREIVRFTEAG